MQEAINNSYAKKTGWNYLHLKAQRSGFVELKLQYIYMKGRTLHQV